MELVSLLNLTFAYLEFAYLETTTKLLQKMSRPIEHQGIKEKYLVKYRIYRCYDRELLML